MANHQPQVGANGLPGAGGSGPQGQGVQGQGQPAPSQPMTQQNLNQIVIDYLIKKGYTLTEETLRRESRMVEDVARGIRPSPAYSTRKYSLAFKLLTSWVDTNLDVYKYELRRTLWPVFIYSYLDMVVQGYSKEAIDYLHLFKGNFEHQHHDVLRTLEKLSSPAQVLNDSTAKLYRDNKYRIPLNYTAYQMLLNHLELHSGGGPDVNNGSMKREDNGGQVVTYILTTYCNIQESKRGLVDKFSFEALINHAHSDSLDETDLREGIPGAFEGVSNQDMPESKVVLKLGAMAMETDLAQDVRAQLEDEDLRNPPGPGMISLVNQFDMTIKREDSEDGPSRNEIPLPPSRAHDVAMEVQKIKEHRDRLKIESRTGGVGPAVSVCMFTFHNTLDAITCIEFSDDNNLAAVGTEESYIRVWNMHGASLPSILPDTPPSSSRRLIGHSASVYGVSFSPSIEYPGSDYANSASTAPKLLLSCSSDKTIRLWSLETWTCLVVYKGHEGPVWDVRWSPFGHYFATCGWDKTVRVWGQDHISYLRMMVGHDSNVNQIAWHPNGAYVFSASDQVDKTVRMWSFTTGECVRVFSGHIEFVSALECSPNGKILASADGGGSIILWDLAKGTQIKRCRGHGKGGIWSLSFSVESTVLVSGGADGTVRLWDVEVPAEHKISDGEVIGTGGQGDATRITNSTVSGQAVATSAAKKKGKDTTITPDQILAFPTKKSPVYKTKFTRMNLVLAGGCYLPTAP
ncbi:WD40-repeat-containing domain protein [Calycina marina]|uniref:WD40-repeat-containing domain protein n=1 Tax=Calycina marina TaxID=1763456 RepID=A0A9P8CJ75_9HELO|nr:WD40-repeat-containing domain protein [Calycina marina]